MERLHSPKSVANRNLFHRKYLESKFAAGFPDVESQSREAFGQLRDLFVRSKPQRFGGGKEKVLREEFLDKALRILGWHFSSEGGIHGTGTRPDYTLFLTEAEKEDALSKRTGQDFFGDAIALCEAKSWATELFAKGREEGPSPRGQIYGYIEATHKQWGIVTNGKLWMLVSRDFSRAQQRDYTVDLEELLSQPTWTQDFNFFYLIFRRESFADGFLLRSLQESRTSGEIGYKELKKNVFAALQLLGQGLKTRHPELFSSAEGLEKAKENCLILLYRLLFISYAESRGLFPMGEADHYRRALSLLRVKESVKDRAPSMAISEYEKIDQSSTRFLENLRKLFRVIDKGHAPANLTPYNGGLFRAEENPFLEKLELDDRTLAQVVDLMSRSTQDPDTFFDYSYLGVRELGSIYEGVLEFNFQVATEDMIATKAGALRPKSRCSEEEVRRAAESISVGSVYLATDKGERKSTGSYFTPHNIVMDIVRTSLAPLVKARVEEARLKGQDAELALLSIKVLDPAMGSGHFLVGATDFLAEKLIEIVEAKVGPPADRAEGEELEAWAKRQVVSHCVYGVDLNAMSVELAKVSLWLSTFSRNHPLTFLDHRLKAGNSLIGAFVRELPIFPPELASTPSRKAAVDRKQQRFDTSGLVDKLQKRIAQIEAVSDDTLKGVEQKKEFYQKLVGSEEYQRLRQLANLYVSLYFVERGLEENLQKQWDPLVQTVLFGELSKWREKLSSDWARDGIRIAQAKSAFHWDLEFPEVFYRESPGFDVVLGNPPYVRAETADKAQRQYLMRSHRYETIYGRFDLYPVFYELASKLCREGGNACMIIPAAVLAIDYATKLRKYLIERKTIVAISDLRGVNVFPDVNVECCILLTRQVAPTESHEISYRRPTDGKSNGFEELHRIGQAAFKAFDNFLLKIEIPPSLHSLKARIEAGSVNLGQICYCITGVVAHHSETGQSKDRLIHSTRIDDTCRPYIEAKEWDGRYSFVQAKRFIQYKPEEMHRPKFPELFESPKILIQGISSGVFIPATLDTSGIYCNHSLNCCVKLEDVIHHGSKLHLDDPAVVPDKRYDLHYVLGLLCSRLIGVYHSRFVSNDLGIFPETIRNLPLAAVAFDQKGDSASRRQQLDELFEALDGGREAEFLNNVQRLVDQGGRALTKSRGKASGIPPSLHDLVSRLAGRMLQSQKEKRERKDAFVHWLESPLGIGRRIGDLRNRAKLLSFDEEDDMGSDRAFALIEAVFAENKVSIGSEKLASLRGEYQNACRAMKPILAAIAKTDKMLDEVVYRLYRLDSSDRAAVEAQT